KSKRPVVTGATGAAYEVIKARAQQLDSPLIHCSDEMQSATSKKVLSNPASNALRGAYQRQNTTIALEMLFHAAQYEAGARLKLLSTPAIEQGLKNVYWPGRFQAVDGIILDGAHNVAGAKALRSSLDEQFPNQNFHFVFSCYANKDGTHMLEALIRPGD